MTQTIYEFAGYTLNVTRRRLFNSLQEPVPLGSRVFDTLVILVEHAGVLVDKRRLIEVVWREGVVSDNSLDRNVSLLRRALGDSARATPLIVTEWGRGYRFTAEVRRRTQATSPRAGSTLARSPDLNETQPSADDPCEGLPEVERLVLQGQALIRRGDVQSFHAGLERFRQAIAEEPRFARAYSALAVAYAATLVLGIQVADPVNEAERLAREAIRLDPNLAEAHGVLGEVESFRCRWRAAAEHFQIACRLDPGDAYLMTGEAMCVQASTGMLTRAREELLSAYAVAPANPLVLVRLSCVCSFMARDDEAEAHIELAVSLGVARSAYPVPYVLAGVASRSGRLDEAADLMETALDAASRAALGDLPMRAVYRGWRDPVERDATLAGLRELAQGGVEALDTRFLLWLIQVSGALDDLDCSFALAAELPRRLARRGYLEVLQALWVPELARFRKDPRFSELGQALGFTG